MEWIAVSEKLPEVVYDDRGAVNCVLALWRPGMMADNLPNPQVCNTVYFRKNARDFSHWADTPPLPKEPA